MAEQIKAYLSNIDEYTTFTFGDPTFSFLTSKSLERYTCIKEWDNGYLVVMAAFAVSGSFVFGDHLAFTAGNDPYGILALITGKLCADLYAVIIAMTVTKNTHAK